MVNLAVAAFISQCLRCRTMRNTGAAAAAAPVDSWLLLLPARRCADARLMNPNSDTHPLPYHITHTKILNRARPESESKERKTATGKTFRRS